jgi:hypothetical protein
MRVGSNRDGSRNVPKQELWEYAEKTSLSGCVPYGFKNTPGIVALPQSAVEWLALANPAGVKPESEFFTPAG